MNKLKGFPLSSTDVLTEDGWVSIGDVNKDCTLLTYNIEKAIIERDSLISVEKGVSNIFNLHHKTFSVNCAEGQNWYGWKRMWAKKGLPRPKKYLHFDINDSTQEFNIINSATYEGGTDKSFTVADGNFLGWLLSDGYYKWAKDTKRTSSSNGKKRGLHGMIAQAQHKFYKEVEDSIRGVGISYSTHIDSTGIKTSPVNKYHFMSKDFRDYMDSKFESRGDKHEVDWSKYIISWGNEVIDSFLYSFWLADGDTKGNKYCGRKMIISQNEGNISDSVILSMFFKGRKVSACYKDSTKKCESLRLLKNAHTTLQETSYNKTSEGYCVSLVTGNNTYIIRQNKTISITSCL